MAVSRCRTAQRGATRDRPQIGLSGGTLDILAVDEEANLVIVELKRDRTPRDVVAQTLYYASSVQDFGREDVARHAREFMGKEFEPAFTRRFGREVPESVNGRHRMYIVASSLDPATMRIVEYLSRVHGVDINAAPAIGWPVVRRSRANCGRTTARAARV